MRTIEGIRDELNYAIDDAVMAELLKSDESAEMNTRVNVLETELDALERASNPDIDEVWENTPFEFKCGF